MKKFRLFLSSPGDVGLERELACKVIKRVEAARWHEVRLEPYLWEHEPMLGTQTYQASIDSPGCVSTLSGGFWKPAIFSNAPPRSVGVMTVVEKCEKRGQEKHQKEVAAASNEFERFLGAKSPLSEATEDTASTYRKDHLLLIDAENGKLDELFYELPTSVRAAKEAEVGTLVWIRWDAQTIGRYTTGGYATKTDCDLTVFDVARRAIVGHQHIEGERPPQTISHRKGSSASWSQRPTEQVLGYLKGLPVRQTLLFDTPAAVLSADL